MIPLHMILLLALTGTAISLLIIISIIDIKTMEIPYRYNLSMMGLGLLAVLYDLHFGWIIANSLTAHLLGTVCVSLPLFLTALIFKDSIGGGDILLTAGAGLYLGWKSLLYGVAIGAACGGIFGAVMLLTKRLGPKDVFPFGPFLSAGIALMIIAVPPEKLFG